MKARRLTKTISRSRRSTNQRIRRIVDRTVARPYGHAVRRRKITVVGTLPSRVSIVGTGAVGSTLALLLFEKGYTIASLINRTAKPALSLAREVNCHKVSTSVSDIAHETEILIFAVSDDALPEVVQVAAKGARLRPAASTRKPLVLHTSGVHSLEVLKPFHKFGIGSLHPIQSFPASKSLRERVRSVGGIHFGIEGEGKTVELVQQLVRVLGGRSYVIPKGMKPLYHAACVLSSNYVVALLNAVSETAGPLGLTHEWKELMLPLFTTTVENAMRTTPRRALTGPIARNDVHTVTLHLEALRKFAPQLVPLYTVMGIESARIARQDGRLTPDQFREFVSTMRVSVRKYMSNGSRRTEKSVSRKDKR